MELSCIAVEECNLLFKKTHEVIGKEEELFFLDLVVLLSYCIYFGSFLFLRSDSQITTEANMYMTYITVIPRSFQHFMFFTSSQVIGKQSSELAM